jgi:CRP-like cAMP-binding protein
VEIGSRMQALRLFTQRLEFRSAISEADRAALMDLAGVPQQVEAHRDFVRLGERVQHACLVTEGVIARFAQLEDGSRQVIGFYIPGDMVDLYSLMLPSAPSPLQALTRSTILKIPHSALREIAFHSPELACAFWRDCVADGQLVAQWLVNVGRKNARSRVAHLICEMAVRYDQIGQMRNGAFPLPLTQEQIADATGLTPVHVNRSLRALREEGLVGVARREAVIRNWAGLSDLAEFDPTYLHLPTSSGTVQLPRWA